MQPSIWTDHYENLPSEEAFLGFWKAGFFCGELGIDHSLILQARNTDIEKAVIAFRSFWEDQGFTIPDGHLDFQKSLIAPGTVDAFKKEITPFQAIGIRHAVIYINGNDGTDDYHLAPFAIKTASIGRRWSPPSGRSATKGYSTWSSPVRSKATQLLI